jgi:Metal binding domain of Ada
MRYTLIGADGRPYPSAVPGTLGGHRGARLYGRLDCPSALRALARGGYAGQRVFFADAGVAVAAGYRPCAVCLPEEYRRWRDGLPGVVEVAKVVELVRAQGARTVVIGHGRDAAPAAGAFAEAWDGEVLAVVGWPEEAASWPWRRLGHWRACAAPTTTDVHGESVVT